ncbi:MAG: hypothetical protein Q4D85_01840 [Corynebacterium sp.]|uniref:hypothetical protein n=1 Tax=Corynebacterium sp. TaxID=1720 RepID=UPI0026DCDE4A|nr:hypothetical protein [Corynebacterium sp.]MDO5097471.1 hypothetical protein [Corynebacterium sp.]
MSTFTSFDRNVVFPFSPPPQLPASQHVGATNNTNAALAQFHTETHAALTTQEAALADHISALRRFTAAQIQIDSSFATNLEDK